MPTTATTARGVSKTFAGGCCSDFLWLCAHGGGAWSLSPSHATSQYLLPRTCCPKSPLPATAPFLPAFLSVSVVLQVRPKTLREGCGVWWLKLKVLAVEGEQPLWLPTWGKCTGLAGQCCPESWARASPSLPTWASSPPLLLQPVVLQACPGTFTEGFGNIAGHTVPKVRDPGTPSLCQQERQGESKRSAFPHAPLLKASQESCCHRR